MTQKDNILQELNELQSTLGNVALQNIYEVPNGYFEGFANHLLNLVKSIDAKNPQEELFYLSPVLSNISKTTPYSIPFGYFESLEERLNISKEGHQTVQEELAAISPLLSSLNKQTPYNLPQGYFENLEPSLNTRVNEQAETRVVSMFNRRWFRYAAAAILVGVVALGGFIFEAKRSIDPNKSPDEWVAKNVKKVSTDKLDDFIRLADEESSSKDEINNKDEKTEIKALMKDVPENQIQDFINETSALGNGDNTSMN